MSRNTVFLEEMGVGPLWCRRDGGAPDGVQDAAPAAASAAVVQTRPAVVAEPVPVAAVAVPVLVPVVTPVAEASSAPAFEPAPVATVTATAQPIPALDDDCTAWFDDAEPPPPPAPVSDQAIAAMGWTELKAALAKCTRCELCNGRKGVVPGRGAQEARWLIVGAGPSRADEKEARPVSGEAGQLLENMLRAIGVDAAGEAYVTNLVKCRPLAAAPGEYAPTPDQAAACRPYLERELALTGARSVVTLGQPAAAGLLGQQAASRGVVRQLGAAAVVATYHPQDLLGQSAAKARAWADLCLAKNAHGAPD